MAGAVYKVIAPGAPRKAADAGIGQVAEQLRAAAVLATPRKTGLLARSWYIQTGYVPAIRFVKNPVPYARFVEYGSKRRRANPFFGRTIAQFAARPNVTRKRRRR
jgi:hypothetical protein